MLSGKQGKQAYLPIQQIHCLYGIKKKPPG